MYEKFVSTEKMVFYGFNNQSQYNYIYTIISKLYIPDLYNADNNKGVEISNLLLFLDYRQSDVGRII